MPASAPSSAQTLSRSGEDAAAITRAPSRTATSTVAVPMLPAAPSTTTHCPGRSSPAVTSAW